MNIRDFQPSENDYHDAIRIMNAMWVKHPMQVANLIAADKNRPAHYIHHAYFVDVDDHPVAFGFFQHMTYDYHPQRFFLRLSVHPDYEGQGIDRALYVHLIQNLNMYRATEIYAKVPDYVISTSNLLIREGFEVVHREIESHLDLEMLDEQRFEPILNNVRDDGIIIQSLDTLGNNIEIYRKLYDLYHEGTPLPTIDDLDAHFQDWHREFFTDNPRIHPTSYWIAQDGDKYVGFTHLRLVKRLYRK